MNVKFENIKRKDPMEPKEIKLINLEVMDNLKEAHINIESVYVSSTQGKEGCLNIYNRRKAKRSRLGEKLVRMCEPRKQDYLGVATQTSIDKCNIMK